MPKAIVFVSSVIHRPENFIQERLRAKTVIDSFPCFESWIFEEEGASSETLETSYLEPLRTAAIVVFILGQNVTPPLQREFKEALNNGKRTILLLKDLASRDEGLTNLIETANVKYARFNTLAEFEEELTKALTGEIVRAFKDPVPHREMSRTERQLRALFAAKRFIAFRPTFPANFTTDAFTIEALSTDELEAKKGSGHLITVPVDHITLGPIETSMPTVVHVRGRVQWLTIKECWQYLPEPQLDTFGVPKSSQPGEPRSMEVQEILRAALCVGEWRRESEANHGNRQVVYDNDGYYFRAKAQDTRFQDQILVMYRR